MTLLVRNNADILRTHLEHHLAQGVDFFLITDNSSTDTTATIAADYEAKGLAELILEPADTYEQSSWVSRMAHAACECHAADWVIHSDADEFWISCQPGQTLREAIATIPEGCRRLFVQRWNAVIPREQGSGSTILQAEEVEWFDSASLNSLGQALPPKVMHRAEPGVVVAQGNHDVFMQEPGEIDSQDRVLILHFPYRGLLPYINKIRVGGRALLANPGPRTMGLTWRSDYDHYLAGRLPAICRERLPDAEQCAARVAEGRYRQPPNRLSVPESSRVPASPLQPGQPPGERIGIVTLADDNYFCGTRLLALSCGGRLPIVVYDLGLGEAARNWIEAHKGISLRAIPETPLIQAIREADGYQSRGKSIKREWPLWICPSLILAAPFEKVFWIDSDIVVLRDLDLMIESLEAGPFLVEENLAPELTSNPEELYEALPIAHGRHEGNRLCVNAGLSGWDLQRDAHLLDAYEYPIRQIFLSRTIPRHLVKWHDQGCLVWALQQAGYDNHLLKERRWNLCVVHSPVQKERVRAEADDATLLAWIDNLRSLEPEAAVVHWNGNPVPWSA